jgi:hypothetical protein
MRRFTVLVDVPELFLDESDWYSSLIRTVLEDVGIQVVNIVEPKGL